MVECFHSIIPNDTNIKDFDPYRVDYYSQDVRLAIHIYINIPDER